MWNPSGVYGGAPEPKRGIPWWGTAIILVLALGIVVAIGVAFKASEPKTATTTNNQAQAQSNPVQAQAQPTLPPNLSPIPTRAVFGLTINNHYTLTNIESRTPKAGYIYYIADFSVTNNSKQGMLVSPVYFTVQSDQSFSYQYGDVTYLLPKGFKSTTLGPGETTRGELAFEVPSNETIVSGKFQDVPGNKATTQIR